MFVAHGEAREGDYRDFPKGTVITSDEEAEAEEHHQQSNPSSRGTGDDRSRAYLLSTMSTSSSFAPPLPMENNSGAGHHTMDFSLGGLRGQAAGNVNPALNGLSQGQQNQVINILDTPQATNTLVDSAVVDTGFLEGIPGTMFDWREWLLLPVYRC